MLVFSAYGQSKMPPCRGSDAAKWSNCFGTHTWAGGEKYVGEWKDGKRRGEGINTFANGRVQEGFWIDDKFVKPEKINLPSQQIDLSGNEERHRLEPVQNTYSNLPPCPKIDYSMKTDIERLAKWNNCWGRYKVEFIEGFKGVVMEGEWRDSRLNGRGAFILADGNKFVGQLKDNSRHGEGTYISANGDKYVGEWKDDKTHGQGTSTFADGNKYVGEFKDGKYHGQGTFTYGDGRVQEGIWADNQFVRAEKINLANQPTEPALDEERRRLEVSQSTQSNLPTCQGSDTTKWRNCFETYTTTKGDKYVGEWKDGKYHGQGTYTFADGGKYVGEFKENKPNGQGTFTLANGNKYVGEWKDDKYHGQGTYYYLADNKFKGDKYVGEFKDDKKHGQGTYIFADGDKYVGEFKEEKPNGQGTYYYLADNKFKGDKYVGEFKDGKYHGQGTSTFADGNKYVGEFKDGKYHGQGTFTYGDGRVQEGIWADDKFVRAGKIVTPHALTERQRKLEPDRRGQFERIPKPPSVEAERKNKNKNTEFARMKCIDFGFKPGAPAYADCVKEYLKSSGSTLPSTKD